MAGYDASDLVIKFTQHGDENFSTSFSHSATLSSSQGCLFLLRLFPSCQDHVIAPPSDFVLQALQAKRWIDIVKQVDKFEAFDEIVFIRVQFCPHIGEIFCEFCEERRGWDRENNRGFSKSNASVSLCTP